MFKSEFNELVEYMQKEYKLDILNLRIENRFQAVNFFVRYLKLNY